MPKQLIKKLIRHAGFEVSRVDQTLEGYGLLYDKYKSYTMIPKNGFTKNLEICNAFRHIDGDFVECGVWRGGMSAAASEVLGRNRQMHLYDSFEGLPPAKDVDGKEALAWQADVNAPNYHENCAADERYTIEAMKLAEHTNYKLYKGWFDNTVPGSLQKPIGILRLDGDWYDSTMICLDHLFPLVTDGGVIILDDYITWDGCAKAVHDYLSKTKSPSRIIAWRDEVIYIVKKN